MVKIFLAVLYFLKTCNQDRVHMGEPCTWKLFSLSLPLSLAASINLLNYMANDDPTI
jgi:hypothetical protein